MTFLQQLRSSKDLCIFECVASMYLESTKTWVEGKFSISPDGICFERNEGQHEASSSEGTQYYTCIDFEEISLLQKEASSYIFPSITCVVGERKHWFSSFANRDAVFNMLEHFWRECLFMSSKVNHRLADAASGAATASSESRLGKDLLRIVYDSEKTLNQSATSLNRQGKQLDNAMSVAEDIRSDLEVADKKLSLIESWLGVSAFASASSKRQKPKHGAACAEYSAVFHRHGGSLRQKDNYLQGQFLISPERLALVDSKNELIQQFDRKDISAIYLISPWEVKIEQRRFGSRDICFSVITAKLVVAFTFLQRYYGELIEMNAPHHSMPRKYRPTHKIDQNRDETCDLDSTGENAADKFSNAVACIAAAQEQQLVSDAEAKKLHQVLLAMKNLALEINKEQEEQMHKINELIGSVDESDVRLKDDIKRIKRAM